jgi:O-antigen/teichoic acid export membrane protein
MVTMLVAVALDNPKLKWFGALLIAYLFVGGVYDILNALALRKQLARVVTRGRITLAVASMVTQITLGVYLGDARIFIFGLVLGYLVATADLARALRIRLLPGLSKSMVRDVLSRNASDTTYGSFSALLFTVGNLMPAVILTLTAGPTIGGFFALLQRVAFNPVLILTTLLTQSMLPWLAKHRTNAARQIMLLAASKLAWFFLGISLLMLPLAEAFFAFAFGEVWRKAGTFAAVLLVLLPCRVAFEVLANLLVVENRQAPLFFIRAFNLAIGLLVLLVFSMQHPELSFFVYALLQNMVALVGIFVINKVTKLKAIRFIMHLAFVVGFAHVLVAFYMNPYFGSFGAMPLALLSLALGAGLLGWSVFNFRPLLNALKDDDQPTN